MAAYPRSRVGKVHIPEGGTIGQAEEAVKAIQGEVKAAGPEEGGAPAGNQNASKEKQHGVTHSCIPDKKSAEGILKRLKRDAPEIADAYIRGEYPSAAAAGRAAGIPWLQTKSPLEKAQKAVSRLTGEGLEAFAAWFTGQGVRA